MKSALDEVFGEAQKLTEQDRAALIRRLLGQLEGPADESVENAWIEEVDRRLAAYDGGKVSAIPAAQVLKRIASRKRR